MKILRINIIFTILIVTSSVYGQSNDSLFNRLQGLTNNGIDFFNIDGYDISSHLIKREFSKKNIRKNFKKLSIKVKDLVESDSTIKYDNYLVSKTEELNSELTQFSSYYFIKTKESEITAIMFNSITQRDTDFERKFVSLVINGKIPKQIYTPMVIDSINFAGRKIPLGSSCRWMGVNNVQCPYYGQMNWSIHKRLNNAQKTIDNHLELLKLEKKGKVISEEMVDVIFEGTETKAKRVIYDFTGVSSVLVGLSGGKTLTIYLVSAAVRGYFISCVMSFWNNDSINPSGLPPLLEQVMKLK